MTTLDLSERQEEALYWHLMETQAGAEYEQVLGGVLDQLPEHDILTRTPDVMPASQRREVVCVGCGEGFVAYAPEIRACRDCRDTDDGDAGSLPVIASERDTEHVEIDRTVGGATDLSTLGVGVIGDAAAAVGGEPNDAGFLPEKVRVSGRLTVTPATDESDGRAE